MSHCAAAAAPCSLCHSTKTSKSANADGPHDAVSHKIDHIALPTKYKLPGNERRSIANDYADKGMSEHHIFER